MGRAPVDRPEGSGEPRRGAPVDRVEPAVVRVAARDGAGRHDRDEAAAAPAGARRPGRVEWRESRGEADPATAAGEPAAHRPTAPAPAATPAGRQADVDLREQEERSLPEGRPEGSGEPQRGAPVGRAPVDRPEGSGEPRRGAPVDREGPDPSVYLRGDGEPEPAAGVEVRVVPTDPVAAGDSGRP